jgi:ethanolamine utilization protein EutA
MANGSERHSLADHAFGALAGHSHGEGAFDHEHDHDEDFLTDGSTALESVPLLSMGLDVGSSGTQVIFTRLQMRGPGEHRALRRQARSRETLYMSPVALTPLRADGTIDEDRLRRIVDAAFSAAGLTPDEIETGAVILTGAAAERTNAARIAARVAEDVGELVCAAAGDHMEAMLAAYGSGAVEASREGAGRRILLLDVGGATTKLALVEDGRVLATAALSIGGRLIVIDRADRIVRLDRSGIEHARRAGFTWELGETIDPASLTRVAEAMADALAAALTARPPPPDVAALFLTEPMPDPGRLDGIMVSGGVGEYVYDRERRDFGDLGRRLGLALRRRIADGSLPFALLPPGECIRATAVGASEYAVQISGQTIYVSSHAALLPRRNLQILQPPFDCSGPIDPAALAAAIRRHRRAFDAEEAGSDIALALRWRGTADHPRIRALAEGIAAGLADRIALARPLHVMLEGDAAFNLGAVLREEMKIASEVLVVDGIVLRDFDYVDIGRMRLPSQTVPVTVKSLLFGGAESLPGHRAAAG